MCFTPWNKVKEDLARLARSSLFLMKKYQNKIFLPPA
jgi:hypothetical protein